MPSEVLAKMEAGISATAPGAVSPPELASRVYGMGLGTSSYQGHQVNPNRYIMILVIDGCAVN
jgi:hypothetical protein